MRGTLLALRLTIFYQYYQYYSKLSLNGTTVRVLKTLATKTGTSVDVTPNGNTTFADEMFLKP